MPRPVFPVVRLPYDRPDRVARVLDTVRREFGAARRLQPAAAETGRPATGATTAARPTAAAADGTMIARPVPQQTTGGRAQPGSVDQQQANTFDHQTAAVDQMTVGVRDCTITPKAARPEITVTAGGAPYAYLDRLQKRSAAAAAADADDDCGRPYLLVPPVNVTAEISRPPLTTS